MSDIFLSYASEDRERAQILVTALEELGWSVFWDLTIPPGLTWDDHIGSNLEEARCVVVAWSEPAVKSRYVREEAREGRDKQTLIPALFEKVKPPFGFRGLHAADLTSWRGDGSDPAFRELAKGIERVLGRAPKEPEKDKRQQAEDKKKTTAKTRAAKKKTTARTPEERPTKRRSPAANPPAPTWEEDEKLNRRVLIKGGEFLMGSPTGLDYEHPEHQVLLSSFYIQEHEVTNEEYRRFVVPHEFPTGKKRHPVVEVNWDEARTYAKWLGGDLPTEAQWEYAARAGSTTLWSFGNDMSQLGQFAWYDRNSGSNLHQVAQKRPNRWGLFDMHGNVWEWCLDWYGRYRHYPQVDPLNEEPSGRRVVRGGSFLVDADFARSAYRNFGEPSARSEFGGFRVVWPAPSEAQSGSVSDLLEDDCPSCMGERGRHVKLKVEPRGSTMHIVCSEGCGFDMTDLEYSLAKAAGRL